MPIYPSLETIMSALTELQPLGSAGIRVLRLSEGESFSAKDLADIISSDPALSAKMLRLANSAYYGFPRKITTVRDAIVLLGFRAVRSATLAACLVDAMPGSNAIDYEDFWRFSVSVATAAELVARAEGMNEEEAFTAGLLHNIGRLALDQFVPNGIEDAETRANELMVSLAEAERTMLGFTDAELGGAIALQWNFPPALADAIENHLQDADAVPDRATLTGCVVRARCLVRSQGLSDGLESEEPQDLPAEWQFPPLSLALERAGGIDGLLGRVEGFVGAAVPS